MNVRENETVDIPTADGLRLHGRWCPAVGTSRGCIVLVHGLGEHLGRYGHVIEALNGQGWSVLAYDHRGHGRSPGPRGDLAGPDSLLEDLACVLDAARAMGGAGPLVPLGHSMGALVVARFVAERQLAVPAAWSRPVDGVILSSPPFDAGLDPIRRAGIALLRRVRPHVCVSNGLKAEWVCSDAAVVTAYARDPLVHDRISGLLAGFIADEGEAVLACAARWQVPTLLMWSGRDACLDPGGSVRFAQLAPPDVVTAREWPGLAHEIFNEPQKDEVIGHALRWLEQRFPAHGSDGMAGQGGQVVNRLDAPAKLKAG